MTRTTRFAPTLVLLAIAVGSYLATRPPRTAATPEAVSQVGDSEAALVDDVADVPEIAQPAGDAVGRSQADPPSAAVDAERGTKHLLRVTVEGIDDDEIANAIVTVTGLGEQEWPRPWDPRESWPCSGRTSEFDLGPFLARAPNSGNSEAADSGSFQRLHVHVDHPLHLSESVQIPLANGVEDPRGRIVYEASVRFAEVLYWPEFLLSVRDADTDEDLEEVELRIVPTAFMGLTQQPWDDEPFVTLGDDLSSPIALVGGRKTTAAEDRAGAVALAPRSGERARPGELVATDPLERGVMLYARAPGHAWGRIVVDVSKQAERVMRLGSEATLDVRLSNVQLDGYAALDTRATLQVVRRLTDGDVDVALSREVDEPLAAEGVRLEGLVPGEYDVSVELGHWNQEPFVLASEELRLAPGEARELVLALPDAPEPPRLAALGGVVAFPEFGGEDEVRLQFFDASYKYGEPEVELALADMERVGGELLTWSFHVAELPAGVYEARLVPFLKSWMIELTDEGREDLELVLPELAEVIVEAVDARTGDRVPLEEIRYGDAEDLPGRVRFEWSTVERSTVEYEDEPGRFRFWSAPGPAFIGTWRVPKGVDVGVRTQDVELVPGLQTVRLELAPACRLAFEFRVDGDALPTDDSIFYGLGERIRGVDHEGRAEAIRYWLFHTTAEGLYEIDFEGVGTDRFLPIPPRRVEVRAGETTEVVVDLRRR